jgi:hypothetical protein
VKRAGLEGFEELMTASALPNLMDADPFSAAAAPSSSSGMDLLLPEQPNPALGQQPTAAAAAAQPRSLHGAVDAAAGAPEPRWSATGSGPPPHGSTSNGFDPPVVLGMPPAPSVPHCPAHALSFDSDPVPDWNMPARLSAPPSLAGTVVPYSLPAATAAPGPQPGTGTSAFEHSSAPVALPGNIGGARVGGAAGGHLGKPTAGQPRRRMPAWTGSGKPAAADPTGFVLEDLLSHAVENMHIKNASNTKFARRQQQQQAQPSLMVRSPAHCFPGFL